MEVVVLTLIGMPGVLLTLGTDVPQWAGPLFLVAAYVAGIVQKQMGIRFAGAAVKSKAVDTALVSPMKFGDVGKGDVVPTTKAVK